MTRSTTFSAIARRLALVGAAVLAVSAFAAPTAFAGKSQAIRTDGGYVSFNHRGDLLYANDTRGEGWSVVAEIRLKDGAVPISRITDGDGANGNPNSQHVKLREGRDIQLRMCYEDWIGTGHVSRGCSGWQNAEA